VYAQPVVSRSTFRGTQDLPDWVDTPLFRKTIIISAMLVHQSYLPMPQKPKLQPLFTNFTSIERAMLSNQIASDTDFEDDGSPIDEYDDYSPSYPVGNSFQALRVSI